jgi:serine phosphatase RsbU (regulator of sigma subunit)
MSLMRAFLRTALAFGLALGAAAGAAALDAPIDLTARDVFVRPGFDPAWTYAEPSYADAAWTQVPARPGSRPVAVRKLGLPGYPRSFFGSLVRRGSAEFCFVLSFDAGRELLEGEGAVGIYLERIGEGWEAYLNGERIEGQLYRDGQGRLARDRSAKAALIGVDKRSLKNGRNVLALHIVGDPGSFRTGLPAGGPFVVGSYASLRGLGVGYADFALVGIFAFFGLYHVLLFLARPAQRAYLAFGLGAFALALYILSRSSLASVAFADVSAPNAAGLASLVLVFPAFMAFFDFLARPAASRVTWIYGAACLALAFVAAFVAPNAALGLWFVSLPLPLAYVAVTGVAKPLAAARRAARSGAGPEDPARRAGADIGRLLPGAAIAFAAVCADAARFVGGNEPAYSKYGFLAFAACAAWALAAQHGGAVEAAKRAEASVDSRIAERTAELRTAIAEQSDLNSRLRETNLRLQNAMDIQAKDLRMAVQVQQGIFPSKPPLVPGWELAFSYLPEAGVSGDFYDFYVEDGALEGLVVGDVSGHGIASGLVTILARSVFWRSFRDLSGHSLGRVLEEVNSEMSEELSSVENFLTCVLLRLREGQVEYASAGHPELAFRRAGNARANFLVPRNVDDYKGPPLGREGIEAPYHAVKFGLEAGDSLFMYTDGFLEAKSEDGQAFGAENILTSYGRAPEGSAQDMLDYIMDDWRYHIGTALPADDVTTVLLRRKL